jgi:hypothetical protein
MRPTSVALPEWLWCVGSLRPSLPDCCGLRPGRQDHPAAAGEGEEKKRGILGGKRGDAFGRERGRSVWPP